MNCHCIEMCSIKPFPCMWFKVFMSLFLRLTNTLSHMPTDPTHAPGSGSFVTGRLWDPGLFPTAKYSQLEMSWTARDIRRHPHTDFLCDRFMFASCSNNEFSLCISSRSLISCCFRALSAVFGIPSWIRSWLERGTVWRRSTTTQSRVRGAVGLGVRLRHTSHIFPCFSASVCPVTIPARFGLIDPTD